MIPFLRLSNPLQMFVFVLYQMYFILRHWKCMCVLQNNLLLLIKRPVKRYITVFLRYGSHSHMNNYNMMMNIIKHITWIVLWSAEKPILKHWPNVICWVFHLYCERIMVTIIVKLLWQTSAALTWQKEQCCLMDKHLILFSHHSNSGAIKINLCSGLRLVDNKPCMTFTFEYLFVYI